MSAGTILVLSYGAILALLAWMFHNAPESPELDELDQRIRADHQERAARARLRARCPDVTPLGGDGWPLLPTDRAPTREDFLEVMRQGHSFR